MNFYNLLYTDIHEIKRFLRLFFVLLLIPFDDVFPVNYPYVTGINIKSYTNGLGIEWKSNTNTGNFLLFKNSHSPISSLKILSNSTVFYLSNISGTFVKDDVYKFVFLDSNVIVGDSYYYLVLPDSTLKVDSFYPNINFNLFPVVYRPTDNIFLDSSTSNVYVKGKSRVKDLFAKNYGSTVILIWDVDNVNGGVNFPSFKIYRATNEITNIQFQGIKPYVTDVEDFYFEDKDLSYGINYFYAVVEDDNDEIIRGVNSTTNPISIGKNVNIKEVEIIKEIVEFKKVRKKEFLSNFLKRVD